MEQEKAVNRSRIRSPLAGWVGGKFLLAKEIVSRIPEDHQCYCEVFAGAGWVLFRKLPSTVEVLNDLNRDVVTLYRVIKHHPQEFAKQFQWVLSSRDEFDRLSASSPESLTDIQRAARFYFLQHAAYGGRLRGKQTFRTSVSKSPGIHLSKLEEELDAIHKRLNQVYMECRPYDAILGTYDRPDTVFYLDPPYYGCEDYYGKGFWERGDFAKMAGILVDIKGRFLLSINDTPEMRAIFGMFQIYEVETRYTLNVNNSNLRKRELLVTNF